jgi:hypothetical protein
VAPRLVQVTAAEPANLHRRQEIAGRKPGTEDEHVGLDGLTTSPFGAARFGTAQLDLPAAGGPVEVGPRC